MNAQCCHQPEPEKPNACCSSGRSFDWLLWSSLAIMLVGCAVHFSPGLASLVPEWARSLSHALFTFINRMWWGVLIGIVAVGALHRIPRDVVMKILGPPGTVGGIARAVLAGTTLDLCNHGIVLVAMKIYERGASLGQVFAFLIASPWNSFSLTLILISLIGLPLTLLFILLSAVVAIVTGILVDKLIVRPPKDGGFAETIAWKEVVTLTKQGFRGGPRVIPRILVEGLSEGRMILRWVLFGAVLASVIQTFVDPETFAEWFGPTLAGLGLTLVAATIIEVCSEGSTPIASDLVTRGHAPGNGFAFLMAGATTDITEILALREATQSWKRTFLLPALSVPQVFLVGWILNTFA